jgi:hypothetical protein
MSAKPREVAESVFHKNKRREAEISEALRQEHDKHEAAIKNMHRLRSLRLDRDAKRLHISVEQDLGDHRNATPR